MKNACDEIVTSENYTYDVAGNITDAPNDCFQYDTNNRLVAFNGNTVSYDMDGNMLSNGYINCEFDSGNRLISAGGHTYTYNAEDVRIRNLCSDADTVYTYNTNAKLSQLLQKTTNGITTKYVYGLGLIGEEKNGEFKTYHFDFRGSTVAITDSCGNITDTFKYDTYGRLESRTGDSFVIFGYNGRDGVVTDRNGLLYMRARYYSPDMRRFVNADIIPGEISNAVTLNRYAYANGNPVSNIDPFGLSAERGNTASGSNLWNKIINFGKDFLKMGGSILKSAWIIVSGIEFQAGYGAGLRGSADVLGGMASIAAGGKVDLLTVKLAYDEIDFGQEALVGAGVSLADFDWLSFDANEGYYESLVTGDVINYDYMQPETTIELAGIDLYIIVGVNASVSYDYGDVWDRLSKVWSDWF